jgi:DNA polymerase III subunit alpha
MSAETKQKDTPKTITVGSEKFVVAPLSETQRAHLLNEQSKRKKKLDFSRIPLDDKKTWDLIGSGLTKGVFQLEKSLGKRYCKEIKPRSIDELADVISLIRPGCLVGDFREKPDEPGEFSSITATYIKIKNGEWKPEYIHECLEPILSGTYSVPIYQEQIMNICTSFAGFTLKEADVMRKAVGKKKKKLMESLKKKFIEGGVANGHDEELGETIFGWIEAFSDYGFNKAHAVSYADIGYKTAYAKAHHPLQFFKAMLENSSGKQDSMEEIQELVHEARLFHLEVKPPELQLANTDFGVTKSGAITFGLAHIKGVGKGAVGSIQRIAKVVNTPVDFLYHATGEAGKETKLKSNVAEALIKSGALDYLGYDRIKLLAEYKLLGILTSRERKFVFEQIIQTGCTVKEAYLDLLDSKIPNKSRRPRIIEAVGDMNRSLAGTPKKMCIAFEKFLLGIPLSGSIVELYYNPRVDIKCRDLHRLEEGAKGSIGVVIDKIREIKDKNGNRMAFLTVSDETYMLDSVVVFASTYNKVAWILEEGRPVIISGRKNRNSFIANKIDHL